MTIPERIQQAVKKVRDQASFVSELLIDALEWPIQEGVERLPDISFGWASEELQATGLDDKILDGEIWQIQPLAKTQPWGIFLLQFTNEDAFTRGRGMAGPLRKVLRGLVPSRKKAAHLPSWDHKNILFICTHKYRHFTFAHFNGDRPASPALSTFGWVRGQAGFRTLCEFNLPALNWPEDDGVDADAWLRQWAGAFDKEQLTKKFFKEFRNMCGLVASDIAERNRLPEDKANTEAQILLERLLFLYFIQRKGWLNQSPTYLIDEFNKNHRDKPDATSYYQGFLAHIFRRLSSPKVKPPEHVGSLPFLNGGLFEEDPEAFSETTSLRLGLQVGNNVMVRVFDDLLEGYNFTIREDIGGGWRGCHCAYPQISGRPSAAMYLRRLGRSNLLGKAASAHVLAAAGHYAAATAAWEQWGKHLGHPAPKNAWNSRKHRLAGASAICESLKQETLAIDEIERAIDVLE